MNQPSDQLSDKELYKHVMDQLFDLVELEGKGNALQKALVGQHVASGLIGNRGMYDHSPEEIDFWISSYEFLGLTDIAKVLREAKPLIKIDDDEPLTHEMLIDGTYEEEEDDPRLDELEQAYYELDEKHRALIRKRIRDNIREILQTD